MMMTYAPAAPAICAAEVATKSASLDILGAKHKQKREAATSESERRAS